MRGFTRRVINPFTRRFAHRLPGFCLLSYRGRKSGTVYTIPMNVFRDGDDYIFALTYGHEVQWVKNVLATGEAEIQIGDRTMQLVNPRPFTDPQRRLMPLVVRLFLSLQRVHGFLRMSPGRLPGLARQGERGATAGTALRISRSVFAPFQGNRRGSARSGRGAVWPSGGCGTGGPSVHPAARVRTASTARDPRLRRSPGCRARRRPDADDVACLHIELDAGIEHLGHASTDQVQLVEVVVVAVVLAAILGEAKVARGGRLAPRGPIVRLERARVGVNDRHARRASRTVVSRQAIASLATTLLA